MVNVLRTFRDAPSGRIVHPGDKVDPTPSRHDELARQGLVEERQAAGKAARSVENKMAPVPANKAITMTAPVAVAAKRGRPPGRRR